MKNIRISVWKFFRERVMIVVYWIKNGVVDVASPSVSSAADIPISCMYNRPSVMCRAKGRRTSKEPMSIEEMKNLPVCLHSVKAQMPDIQNFMKEEVQLHVRRSYHVVDDLSTVVMVANGFGICLMPGNGYERYSV